MSVRQPAIFISHGSPMVGIEDDAFTSALSGLGNRLARPAGIAVMSAHWEADGPVRITTSDHPETIHDFGGFPDSLYELTYPSPGSPSLARELGQRLGKAGFETRDDPHRGYDHGAWIPLRRLFPKADVPVVQLSLPRPRSPRDLERMGEALGPLRSEGILLMGTGGVVHNLRRLHFAEKDAPVDSWAGEFDAWIADALRRGDEERIRSYREIAPHASLAVPTADHFDPLFFALGAGRGGKLSFVFEGFHYGNLSMRSFTLEN